MSSCTAIESQDTSLLAISERLIPEFLSRLISRRPVAGLRHAVPDMPHHCRHDDRAAREVGDGWVSR